MTALRADPTQRSRRSRRRLLDGNAQGHVRQEHARDFVADDGTSLYCRMTGPAESPVTLVLVHGWTQDHRTWDAVTEATHAQLGGPLRVLRYDHRGHGTSMRAGGGSATIERLADDLAELIADKVPHGPLVLAGHSMGGMTIMALAQRHPTLVRERVAGVAFVATSSGQMDRITLGLPGLAGNGAAGLVRRLCTTLSRHRRDTLPLRPGVVRAGARWLVFGEHAARDETAKVADQVLRAHPASIGRFQDAISQHNRRVALAGLRGTPVVVLAGSRDRLCPPRHAITIARELPEATFVRFPGAGHMLPQERPREVAERIATLVRTAAAPAASQPH